MTFDIVGLSTISWNLTETFGINDPPSFIIHMLNGCCRTQFTYGFFNFSKCAMLCPKMRTFAFLSIAMRFNFYRNNLSIKKNYIERLLVATGYYHNLKKNTLIINALPILIESVDIIM